MILAFEHLSHFDQAAALDNGSRLLAECICGMTLPVLHVLGLLASLRLAAADERKALGAVSLPLLWSLFVINYSHALMS